MSFWGKYEVKMKSNIKTVCVIGLGYVGLPLACLCANKQYLTYGLDINQEVVDNAYSVQYILL